MRHWKMLCIEVVHIANVISCKPLRAMLYGSMDGISRGSAPWWMGPRLTIVAIAGSEGSSRSTIATAPILLKCDTSESCCCLLAWKPSLSLGIFGGSPDIAAGK